MLGRFVRIATLVSLIGPFGCLLLWLGVRFYAENTSVLSGLIGNAFLDLIAGVLLAALALMRALRESGTRPRAFATLALVVNLACFAGLFALAKTKPPMGLSGQTSIFYTPPQH